MIVATAVPSKNPKIIFAKLFAPSGSGKNVTQEKYNVVLIAQNQLYQ
jgi:hypothetical protein